ncbi:MAG: hypothetical protein ACFFE6_02435, partial [Candidatus Thorarchaeota archaeon]
PEASLKNIEVLLTMVGGKIEYVKEGSGFSGLDSITSLWAILPSALIIVSLVALVVFIIFRKNRS